MSYALVSVCALASLVRAIGRAREEARSAQCECKLAQPALALHNYESMYGTLPPAAMTDANGKPLLSWRVVLLPFMEEETLYKQIKLDEPWDGPNNRKFNTLRPSIFVCPSHIHRAVEGTTDYVAVVGPRTLFPGGGRAKSRADIRDDPASTLMVVESMNCAVNWMEPGDLEWNRMSFRVNDLSQPSISSEHHIGSYPGPHVAAARPDPKNNQVVGYLNDSTPPADVRAMLIIDDGENVVLHKGPNMD